MLTLLGVLVVIVGFALGVNALLVVTVAGIVTGLAGGLSLHDVIAAFGKAFIENRYVAIVWMVLPVIGLLERSGLKERARELIARIDGATTGRVLMVYLAARQFTAALGLTSLGGHPQMVRPLIAPMAEGAAESRYGDLPASTRFRIRAHAAAVDNIGVFFGEDIFIAIGSILLIRGFLAQNGIDVAPTTLAKWAAPTAVCAFVIHAIRLVLLDRSLARTHGGVTETPGRMIGLPVVYALMGLMLVGVAIVNVLDHVDAKRYNKFAFWGIYAVTFLLGGKLSDFTSGCLIIGMVLVSSIGGLGGAAREATTRDEREVSARRWGNRLFIPALVIPVVTLLGTSFLKSVTVHGVALVDPKQVTVISLALATVVALAVGMAMLRAPAFAPIQEARRLMDAVGWAAVLPQLLAALGALFAIAGVGTVVSTLVNRWIPLDTAIVAVVTYAVGMALFTIVMGNAFAAFPVMTAGIGLPIIVGHFGGDPAVMAAIGMLSGYCGTLMTPMAANFNIVPAALLELPDENAVIKVQIPTGAILLGVNILLMYFLVFRF